ncbi:hypothetical protein Tco_1247664 [Tanacetum coccineum]
MRTEMELTLEQTQQGVSYEVLNIQVISITMKMEILLEPTSNKLMVEHAEFDESDTYVLERFDTPAGNPVKKILLKLNLSDHMSILTDSKEYLKMVMERQSVKVKEIQERCIIKAFQDYQIKKVEYGVSISIGYGVSSSLSNTAYSCQLINMAYPLPLDTAYRLSGTEAEIFDFRANFFYLSLGQILLIVYPLFQELRENTFSDSDNEDTNEHIEKVLEKVDLFHVPNITGDQLMPRVFPISLTGAASH